MNTFQSSLRNLVLLTVVGIAWLGLAGCEVIKARQLAREGNEAYLAFDYRTAIDKYLAAQKLDPDTPNLYLNLGYSYFSVYDPTAEDEEERKAAALAVQAFQEHLRRHPDDEDARVFEIKTLLKAAPTDKKMADKALAVFQEMLDKNPKDHEARQYMITLFIDCHRYEDAVAFFRKELTGGPGDLETMKILAIIADKSGKTQAAVDWYFKRADLVDDPEKKAVLLYEVGTYVWNLLHYQPDRATGVEAIKLADQGIEACRRAMALKKDYAEAMIYANLLFLKRAMADSDEQGRSISQVEAFELRKAAGKILMARKAAKAADQKADGKDAAAGKADEAEEDDGAADDKASAGDEKAGDEDQDEASASDAKEAKDTH